jgi:DNA-binding beta-propeller fold protein YncE
MPRSYVLILPMLVACAATFSSSRFSGAETHSHSLLLVANKGDQTLGIIDPETGKQIATVTEGGVTGHEVIASPDGRLAYVPIYGDSGVGKPGTDGSQLVVIDIASRKIVGNLDFGHGVRPHCPLFGPKDGLLYVTTEIDNSIAVIDPHSLKIVGSIPTSRPESHMLAISHDGKYGYTTNVGSGTVSVLDMSNRKTVDVIAVAAVVQRIALSIDDRLAFTSDQSKPQLAVIDTSRRKVKTWVPLPAPGYGTAATPDGRWLLIAIQKTRQVAVLNLATMKIEHTIDVPAAPQEVLIRPDGEVAYVSCDASHKIAEIRISDWTVGKLIDAGPGADGLAWAAQ